MARRLRPVAHEDRLSLVEHLTELRVRIIIALVAVCTTTALCMWQNHAVLDILNRPLDQTVSHGSKDPLVQGARYDRAVKDFLLRDAALSRRLALQEQDPQTRAELGALARSADAAGPHAPEGRGRGAPCGPGGGAPAARPPRARASRSWRRGRCPPTPACCSRCRSCSMRP